MSASPMCGFRRRHWSAVPEDVGYRAAMISLARGRVHIAALSVGTAQRALDESVAHAATATQGGTPSATSSSCRRCSPTSRPAMAGRALVVTAPENGSPRRTVGWHRRWPNCSAPRWSAGGRSGGQIHGGTGYMRRCPSNGSIATCGCCACTGTSEIGRVILGSGLVRAEEEAEGLECQETCWRVRPLLITGGLASPSLNAITGRRGRVVLGDLNLDATQGRRKLGGTDVAPQ